MPPQAKRTKGVYPPLLERMRSLGRNQRAEIAPTHHPPAVKTAAGSDFPLELVNLATPSSSRGQTSVLSKQKAIFTTVVLGCRRPGTPPPRCSARLAITHNSLTL